MIEHMDDLIPAYALGALDEVELSALEAHLATCPSCNALAAEMAHVAAALPLALEPMAPPADLKARILAEALGLGASVGAPPQRPQAVEPRGRLTFGRLFLPTLALASVAAALVLGIALGRLALQPEPSASVRYHQLLGLALTRGDIVVPLHTASSGLQLQASVDVSRTGRASIIVGRVPSIPAGKVYQVWFIRKSGPRSAGIITPRAAFPGTRPLVPAKGATVAAMTIEPGPNGTTLPTSAPIASAALQHT